MSTQQLDKSAKGLLDWAESIICNGAPMPHCTQEEWDSAITKWRDAKHESFPDGQSNPSDQPPTDRPEAATPIEFKPGRDDILKPGTYDGPTLKFAFEAPSLQSVAEGAARAIVKVITLSVGDHLPADWKALAEADVKSLQQIITRHFAPLLAERDERIGRMEEQRAVCVQEADKYRRECGTLRTRCEQLEDRIAELTKTQAS